MRAPGISEIKTAGYTALCSAAAAASKIGTPSDAVERFLRGLLDADLISGALVEIDSKPPLRIPVGIDVVASQEDLILKTLKTRSAPAACLYVAGPTRRNRTFLSAVAQQLAMVIDMAFLRDQARDLHKQAGRRIEEVSTIYEIGQAIDSVGIERLLEIITEKAALVMDAQACSLMRMNPQTNALTIAASYGLSEDVVVMSQRALGEGIAGRVAQTGEPMLIVDAEKDPRLSGVDLMPEIGSSMVVPMKDERGRVLGVLSIRRRRPTPDFDQDALRLFSVFASQAAMAITNVQLYEDLRSRLIELNTLSSLTQQVISTLDLTSLLGVVADNIVEVVKFDRCAIFLLDRHSGRFAPRIVRGYTPKVIGQEPVAVGEGVVGTVARTHVPIIENGTSRSFSNFARMLGTSSFVAIPILAKDQCIGVIVADNQTSGYEIQEDNITLLTTFAGQAGLAIENAQLYEDRDLRYHEMNRLATQTDNILRSIASGVFVVDASGTVTRWNKAAEEMWGISESDASGLPYATLLERFGLPTAETGRLQELMEAVSSTGRPAQLYNLGLHPRRKPEIVVSILMSPLIDRQGNRQGVVQTMEDVTREIRMEWEIGRIRRLADIGQLAAKMAHEVRNPLSSIKGAAQLMQTEYSDLTSLSEFLDIIVNEVNALNLITTDLLDFARPMKLDLEYVDLHNLVARTLQFLESELSDHGVTVEIEAEMPIPDIEVDQKQMGQVVRNIALNAMHAMDGGGCFRVSIRDGVERDTVEIVFADTGLGIPEEKLDEVFQPFFTTKTKGTGLGLSIVQKIVENHAGKIEVASRAGVGTSFTVTLPVRQSDPILTEDIRQLVQRPLSAALPDR